VARRTNLTLLGALVVAFATGVLALWVGESRALLVAWLHGAAGLAVVLLVRWKVPVVRRGLRRQRPDAPAAVLTALIAVAVLATGLAHTLGAATVSSLTVMAVHITLALALVPLVGWHIARRPQLPARGDLTRASFLRLAGVALIAVAGKAALEGTLAASRAASGSLRHADPIPTSWLNDAAPSLHPALWRDRMSAHRRREVTCALDCTSGWYSVNRWSGVAVSDLLGPLPPGTRSILVTSATGYSRRFAADEVDGLILADTLDSRPLGPGNGAPARLVVPGRRGFWWVKWVTAIEPSTRPAWWQLPFPLD
jgi:hypothetical protein